MALFSPSRTREPVALSPVGAYNVFVGDSIVIVDSRRGDPPPPLLPGAVAIERCEGEELGDATRRALSRLLEERPPADRRSALVVSEDDGDAIAVAEWLRDHGGCRRTYTLAGGARALADEHPYLFGLERCALPPSIPSQIAPLLFLGERACAEDAAALALLRVDDVVSVTSRRPSLPHVANHTFLEADDDDAVSLAHVFGDGVRAVADAQGRGRRVLVHCERGASRSCSLVLAVLMTQQRIGLDAALGHVRRCRPEAAPNPGFLLQLRELEAGLGLACE